jgi:outer membrane protein assembly factor BamB
VKVDQLIFVGLRGYVIALNRDDGAIVWSNDDLKSGDVSLLLDGDRLVVSVNGYLYCLDPLTGEMRWQNPLHGYGVGIAHLVSCRGQSDQIFLQQTAASEQAAQSTSAHSS